MATAWTIEELVEDALAAYLRARAPIPASVYVAFEKTDEETVRPCVVVSGMYVEHQRHHFEGAVHGARCTAPCVVAIGF
jgi:hypothetical protein